MIGLTKEQKKKVQDLVKTAYGGMNKEKNIQKFVQDSINIVFKDSPVLSKALKYSTKCINKYDPKKRNKKFNFGNLQKSEKEEKYEKKLAKKEEEYEKKLASKEIIAKDKENAKKLLQFYDNHISKAWGLNIHNSHKIKTSILKDKSDNKCAQICAHILKSNFKSKGHSKEFLKNLAEIKNSEVPRDIPELQFLKKIVTDSNDPSPKTILENLFVKRNFLANNGIRVNLENDLIKYIQTENIAHIKDMCKNLSTELNKPQPKLFGTAIKKQSRELDSINQDLQRIKPQFKIQ